MAPDKQSGQTFEELADTHFQVARENGLSYGSAHLEFERICEQSGTGKLLRSYDEKKAGRSASELKHGPQPPCTSTEGCCSLV